jgi:hypothetical protein
LLVEVKFNDENPYNIGRAQIYLIPRTNKPNDNFSIKTVDKRNGHK